MHQDPQREVLCGVAKELVGENGTKGSRISTGLKLSTVRSDPGETLV